MEIRKYAVIVAGGEGNRAGGAVPKQFRLVGGVPLLWWSVRAFHEEDPETEIILVLHPGFFDDWDILYSGLPEEDRKIKPKLVCGGRSRLDSVKNGLLSVPAGEKSLVAVHDAARPMVTAGLIKRGWFAALESGAAVPVVPMADSIRRLLRERSESVPRKDYVKVQTPQIFDADVIKGAYTAPLGEGMTDDASVVEASGHSIRLFEGEQENFKVTEPFDLDIADMLLKRRMNGIS